jgi:hypothetical protein
VIDPAFHRRGRISGIARALPRKSSGRPPTNPKDLNSLVNEVAYATAKEMVKQGLLARQ